MSIFSRRRQQNDFAAEIESHIAIEADRLRQEPNAFDCSSLLKDYASPSTAS